ncbi:hypothetical protein PPTG_19847 [Phytophthora nicotianae INRA-310]|uniref:Secreted protein n=1 Tax=Phytophthora nicotianae (strain INRA-310) TaxID=761204 RepID=W2PCU7_PHYN3|nr:hypothetical protein PPTG_19847 [Phytophthora nicotianae INRA-310]ETM98048.1 hypothetical protein PPTG_19847 [Phytophthora nicotianae INRA-310]
MSTLLVVLMPLRLCQLTMNPIALGSHSTRVRMNFSRVNRHACWNPKSLRAHTTSLESSSVRIFARTNRASICTWTYSSSTSTPAHP